MTYLRLWDVGTFAFNAGWTGTPLAEAMAVSFGEARYLGWTVDTLAVHVNADGSRDRGMWAINDRAHPDVTDAMAFDPRRATAAARRLYVNQGWRPWVAYAGPSYQEAYPIAVVFAPQIETLPLWTPLTGWDRRWDYGLDHWTYRNRPTFDRVIDQPLPPPRAGFSRRFDFTADQWVYLPNP